MLVCDVYGISMDIDRRIDCIELLILDPLRKQYSPIAESSAGSAKAALCFLSLEIVSCSVPSIQRMVCSSYLLLLQFLFQPQVRPSTKLQLPEFPSDK